MKQITFTACEHLDFSDKYCAEKNLINLQGETKVCWNRSVIDSSYPALVQFCTKRGRMNSPEMCVCERTKMCNDYKDFKHKVDLITVNTK